MEDGQLHLLVACNIRIRREFLGLSQEGLADRSGIHRTYIGSIERGERNVTINTLARIAAALNCTVVDFLSSDNQNENRE